MILLKNTTKKPFAWSAGDRRVALSPHGSVEISADELAAIEKRHESFGQARNNGFVVVYGEMPMAAPAAAEVASEPVPAEGEADREPEPQDEAVPLPAAPSASEMPARRRS